MAASVLTDIARESIGADRDRLEQRASILYLRLEDGYARIERALDEGQDISRWEDLWHRLLREYEQVSDLLAVANQ
ncbi:MAG TPA: hypothetical protein VHA53_02910 [Nitrolancea sp.]|jgi:hypothetical protein|nr:hypothetical protein [Nitrolancea sp.]